MVWFLLQSVLKKVKNLSLLCLNFLKMSLFATLNRTVFKRTSTYTLAIAAGTFFFERTFEIIATSIFESVNQGKLWKDIEHRYAEK